MNLHELLKRCQEIYRAKKGCDMNKKWSWFLLVCVFAAAARALPSAILVCSGGATGENNPEGHTEAGLMKKYLSEICGIDAERIFIDEKAMTTAENAVNTFEILRKNRIKTMTIVTSAYHQRWGQAVYNAVGAVFRERYNYDAEIVGNYCLEIEPSVEMYRLDDRIAVMQIAQILGLPEDVVRSLPSLRMTPSAAESDQPKAA